MKKKWLALCLAAAVWCTACQKENSDAEKQDIRVSVTSEVQEVKPVESYEEVYKLMETRIAEKKDENRKYLAESRMNSGIRKETALNAPVQNISQSHGSTNVVTEGIDESDILKNDGQYLYIQESNYQEQQVGVRIVKVAKEDMEEVSFIPVEEKYGQMEGLYIEGDQLIIITINYSADSSTLFFYQIEDRSNPVRERVLAVDGMILETRLSKGYVYVVSQKHNEFLNKKKKQDYIPKVEGCKVSVDSIYAPEKVESCDFVTCQTIPLTGEHKTKSSLSVLASGEYFYMSGQNMYVCQSSWNQEQQDSEIMRISYEEGNLKMEAKGTVEGILTDAFSINEYKDHIRLVTQKEIYEREKGGKETINNTNQGKEQAGIIRSDTVNGNRSTKLSVLNLDLKLVGKIENIAPDEQIHSVRFLGDIGYFVTFRQIDPLFSVDLSDPKHPEILGELKIPGFSEYLHPYSEDLLLGIGYSVEENHRDCIKLSMFNKKDPEHVAQEHVTELSEYEGCEGIYNYKAICIEPEKNLFGFACESYENGKIEYILCSYDEKEGFKVMKTMSGDTDTTYTMRGTFVGDTFYSIDYGKQIVATDLHTMKQAGILKL